MGPCRVQVTGVQAEPIASTSEGVGSILSLGSFWPLVQPTFSRPADVRLRVGCFPATNRRNSELSFCGKKVLLVCLMPNSWKITQIKSNALKEACRFFCRTAEGKASGSQGPGPGRASGGSSSGNPRSCGRWCCGRWPSSSGGSLWTLFGRKRAHITGDSPPQGP